MPQREDEKIRKPRNVRMSDDEHAEAVLRAQAAGYEFSAYVRACVLGRRLPNSGGGGRKEYLARQQQINELRKLGGLLKHLFVESGGYDGPLDPAAFAGALSAVTQAARRIQRSGDAG